MAFAPQQNWTAYHDLTNRFDRQNARALSLQQRFALYEDLFQIVCCRHQSFDKVASTRVDRAEQRRWAKKLDLRHKFSAACQIMDEHRREDKSTK